MTNLKHLATGSTLPPHPKGKVRVYSMRFCPYAHRVHLTLEAKKIPYDVVFVNLSQKPEWLLEKSPFGKVPAVELESGDVLYESLLVTEYLDSLPGRKLCSPDPLQQVKDKILLEHFNRVISAFYKIYVDSQNTTPTDILEGLDYFEKELIKRNTPFYGGAQRGYVDYMMWPWFERMDVLVLFAGPDYKMPQERYPKLLEWKSAMMKDEAVKGYFLEAEIHAKFFKSRETEGKANYDLLATD